jgi:hypothetical protein
MKQKRFVETGKTSFFGEYLYNQVVPMDHFLRKVLERMDWRQYQQGCSERYKIERKFGEAKQGHG